MDDDEDIARAIDKRRLEALRQQQADELQGIPNALAAFNKQPGALGELLDANAAAEVDIPQPLRPGGARGGLRRWSVPSVGMAGGRRVVVGNVSAGPPDWTMWSKMPSSSVWEAVALSLNRDPGDRMPTEPELFDPQFPKRLRVAMAHLALPTGTALRVLYGNPTSPNAIVSLPEFGTWALSLPWTIPTEFPRTVELQEAATIVRPLNRSRWPWGGHHTEVLGHLEAAALRFWVRYDPGDSTTAETNSTVSNWLQSERKVSKTMADAIASMLRPDGLPTGPRK